MSVKKAMATAMLLETRKDETVEFLANNIAQTFSLLANTEPLVALEVLNQMNNQFNEDICEELVNDREEKLEMVASQMHIDESELD